jgi:hypothetical protein
MSKSTYFKVQQLKKDFNKAMAAGDIVTAKRIDKEINTLLGY